MALQRPTRIHSPNVSPRGAPGLITGPHTIEIDRIVIRYAQDQFEVSWCRNEELIVKGNFGWACSMWAGRLRIDLIVIRDVQYQFEVNGCRNEEVIFQGSSAYSVGWDSGQDGWTDSGDNHKKITDIYGGVSATNILTKFHKDWMKTINILTKFHKDWMKTATSIVYTSDLINILTKFHKDWMKTVTSTVYTNKLLTDFIKINILTEFHKDWMKTATSIVYTSDLINILTKFHKDRMKTVTSTVYTNKLLTDTCIHTPTTDARHHMVT
ncbi:hypothetical protein DPMN_031927 [Dreissena polymorpha]|uniref:Uncharacterized protein n=1 Tax=Dreissena polymorpha TaxID=45954 RepID=A0A9D4M307_DREPO|nr:hypothetical protein DPMN_031927 [Dreissena polymorpha]